MHPSISVVVVVIVGVFSLPSSSSVSLMPFSPSFTIRSEEFYVYVHRTYIVYSIYSFTYVMCTACVCDMVRGFSYGQQKCVFT